MSLSDKIQRGELGYDRLDVLPVEDVKEAVKELKKEVNNFEDWYETHLAEKISFVEYLNRKINKIFGKELTE